MGRINRRRDRWLKRCLEWLLRPFFRRPPLRLADIVALRPRRVLVVRQHNQMGDMVCALPALAAIHETFGGPRILVVTAPVNHGVVLGVPEVDGILIFDKVALRRSPLRVWRFLRELRRFRADVAVVLNSVSYSGTSSWLAVLSGARAIVGGDSRPFGWSFSQWLYNLALPSTPRVTGPAVEHGLRPLAAVGFSIPQRRPVLRPRPEDEERAATFLSALGEGPRVGVHPGAGKPGNRWPAERFARAIEAIEEEGGRVWLVEGPADAAATAQTLEALGRSLPVLRGAGTLTVAAALAASDLALVNDTGLMHVAGAVGTPTLALFGPTPAAVWKPPVPWVEAIESPNGSMEGITVEEVVGHLRARLAAATTGDSVLPTDARTPRRR